MTESIQRKPEWLKVQLPSDDNFIQLKRLMRTQTLHTVCEEARCPNIGECWSRRTATFMILGDVCTRACRFCAVKSGRPDGLDRQEPERVAAAVIEMGLAHVVITSVARDDLADGGAGVFAACIQAVRERNPLCRIEVLVPDFLGDREALAIVLRARPDVLNHNIETVRRLTPEIRSKATYDRSLSLLAEAKRQAPQIPTKSSIMVGLGEQHGELLQTMDDLRQAGCDILTIGQYLPPTKRHARLARYYTPEEFAQLRQEGLARGFAHVESGPLVRSSYHAREQMEAASQRV